MQHCDEETLALAALEPSSLSELNVQHVNNCAECTAELESFRSVTSTVRDVGPLALAAALLVLLPIIHPRRCSSVAELLHVCLVGMHRH